MNAETTLEVLAKFYAEKKLAYVQAGLQNIAGLTSPELLENRIVYDRLRDDYLRAEKEYQDALKANRAGVTGMPVQAQSDVMVGLDLLADAMREILDNSVAEEYAKEMAASSLEVVNKLRALTPPVSAPIAVAPEITEAQHDSVRDAIAQAIGGQVYDCTRHWSAWGYGTMSEDDFRAITDSPHRISEIADAAIAAISATPQSSAVPVAAWQEMIGRVISMTPGKARIEIDLDTDIPEWVDLGLSLRMLSGAAVQPQGDASELPEPFGYMSPADMEHIRSRTEQYRGRNYNIKATVFLDRGHSEGSATEPVFTADQMRALQSPPVSEGVAVGKGDATCRHKEWRKTAASATGLRCAYCGVDHPALSQPPAVEAPPLEDLPTTPDPVHKHEGTGINNGWTWYSYSQRQMLEYGQECYRSALPAPLPKAEAPDRITDAMRIAVFDEMTYRLLLGPHDEAAIGPYATLAELNRAALTPLPKAEAATLTDVEINDRILNARRAMSSDLERDYIRSVPLSAVTSFARALLAPSAALPAEQTCCSSCTGLGGSDDGDCKECEGTGLVPPRRIVAGVIWPNKADYVKALGDDFFPNAQAAQPAQGTQAVPDYSGVVYMIEGFGETDCPEIEFAITLDEARSAVIRMVFGSEDDADTEQATDLLANFDDPDHWPWKVDFEIGGIRVQQVVLNNHQIAGPKPPAVQEGE